VCGGFWPGEPDPVLPPPPIPALKCPLALASRRLVASYPCPDKGDQAKANDPCGDDDPSDRVEAEYGCSFRGLGPRL
jgi:hypothetical protein